MDSANEARRATRICSRVQRGAAPCDGLDKGLVTVFSPVGLDEDAVDLFEIDDAGLVAHGFDEAADAQVAGAAQQPFAGANDEREGFEGEGVVAESGAIELGEDERLNGFGSQARQHDRVGDAGADLTRSLPLVSPFGPRSAWSPPSRPAAPVVLVGGEGQLRAARAHCVGVDVRL